MTERDLRQQILAICLEMNASGLNHGVSGNVSARLGDRMLITPSGVAYETMSPDMIAEMEIDDASGAWSGPLKPSTEWPFHRAILNARPDVQAIVHAHPIYCTALSMSRRVIPAAHYMIAIFGGTDVRCADYATFGTEALSQNALEALDGRMACLLANHGMIALGETLDKAIWRATELEVLAHQYVVSLGLGGPVLLTEDEMSETFEKIASYGKQADA